MSVIALGHFSNCVLQENEQEIACRELVFWDHPKDVLVENGLAAIPLKSLKGG